MRCLPASGKILPESEHQKTRSVLAKYRDSTPFQRYSSYRSDYRLLAGYSVVMGLDTAMLHGPSGCLCVKLVPIIGSHPHITVMQPHHYTLGECTVMSLVVMRPSGFD
ncbi:hypothetical protein BaRGS_00008431 [Batillaria attramentaria]|uniref:Uncharacterized protein n=1 Tax=Batillaria attramentaria TaxID=370345 RepID=A0ABD0LMH9_9CAEN